MSIQCKHCGAGRVYLQPLVEYLESGEVLETVRCIRCSWRVSRAQKRQVRGPVTPFARRQDQRRDNSQSGPCSVPGCQRPAQRRDGGYEICGMCRKAVVQWIQGRRTKPPPIQRVNKVWIHRDHGLMPGIA
jgi:hypothetical protein